MLECYCGSKHLCCRKASGVDVGPLSDQQIGDFVRGWKMSLPFRPVWHGIGCVGVQCNWASFLQLMIIMQAPNTVIVHTGGNDLASMTSGDRVEAFLHDGVHLSQSWGMASSNVNCALHFMYFKELALQYFHAKHNKPDLNFSPKLNTPGILMRKWSSTWAHIIADRLHTHKLRVWWHRVIYHTGHSTLTTWLDKFAILTTPFMTLLSYQELITLLGWAIIRDWSLSPLHIMYSKNMFHSDNQPVYRLT